MYKRIVVKVGTKVLSADDGMLDGGVLRHLVKQIGDLKQKGVDVVLVTSGAVGAGRGLITLKQVDMLAKKQVFAAVGQVKLMSMYADAFAKTGRLCAQVLATKEDFRDKAHYFNMQTCFQNLLSSGVVPIVNENDVVATTELLFTDNDELAGLVASQLHADAVVILTSVEGFLMDDRASGKEKVVSEIDLDVLGNYERYISPTKTDFGRGGMLTKFAIARKLTLQGIPVHIANGKRKNVLLDIIDGKAVGTKFLARGRSSSVKRRIAYSEGLAKGFVKVNKCAEELLRSKERAISLLPVGVVAVGGDFDKGDIIEITGEKKRVLGFGIAEYGAERAKELLGKKNARCIIHYDHMFIDHS